MKKKLSSLVLAIGLTATPAFAKHTVTKRANTKAKSGIQQNSKDKRVKNSLKRFLQLEAEKDFIKETEEEVEKVISSLESDNSAVENNKTREKREIVYKDEMPKNNIEIKLD